MNLLQKLYVLAFLTLAHGFCMAVEYTSNPARIPDTLRVMTFNIRYKNKEDKDKGKGWNDRLPLIIDIINTYQPDIIGIQEAKKDQISDLNEHIGKEYNWYGEDRKYYLGFIPGGGEYNPIFFRNSILEKKNTDTFWLNKDNTKGEKGWDAQDPRICSWIKFEIRATKKRFFFFNTHLDHVGEKARIEGARLIGKKITNKTDENTIPAFLVGDFNAWIRQEQGDGLSGILFHDPHHFTWAKTLTQNVTGPAGTYTGFFNLTRISAIDYILLNNATLFEVKQYGIIEPKDGNQASDHRPVFADVKIK